MDYKIIVRTCDDRENFLCYLIERIPNLIVVKDKDRNAMHTFLDALEIAEDYPCVHLEDDIILTCNFTTKLHNAIQDKPNVVLQFFSMRKDDIEIGSRFDSGGKFISNLCFYLPYGYSCAIKDFYCTWTRKDEHPTGCDLLVADFLKSRKEKYFIHIPNLVQHRITRSLINPKRSMFRLSKTFKE